MSISDLRKKNFDDFYDLLCSLPQPPLIIALSETQINFHPLTDTEIPGYTFYYSNFPSKLVVRERIRFKLGLLCYN